MKSEYDFSKAKRGAVIPQKGKTRISIFIDNAILVQFRARAEKAGTGYQTMMNEALRAHLSTSDAPVTIDALRNVLREEMPEYLRNLPTRSSGAAKSPRRVATSRSPVSLTDTNATSSARRSSGMASAVARPKS